MKTPKPQCNCRATDEYGRSSVPKNHDPYCPVYQNYRAVRDRINRDRREHDEALRSLGLVKVRVGGETFWE